MGAPPDEYFILQLIQEIEEYKAKCQELQPSVEKITKIALDLCPKEIEKTLSNALEYIHPVEFSQKLPKDFSLHEQHYQKEKSFFERSYAQLNNILPVLRTWLMREYWNKNEKIDLQWFESQKEKHLMFRKAQVENLLSYGLEKFQFLTQISDEDLLKLEGFFETWE